MKTQIILASYETSSFFVFPARAVSRSEIERSNGVLPALFEWEPSATPEAKGHLHAHILVEADWPPDFDPRQS